MVPFVEVAPSDAVPTLVTLSVSPSESASLSSTLIVIAVFS